MQCKRNTNPWWEFVKTNMKDLKHIETRKDKFQLLSEMWENEKAKIVTVNVEYLLQLNNTIVDLKSQVYKLKEENDHMKKIMLLIEDN